MRRVLLAFVTVTALLMAVLTVAPTAHADTGGNGTCDVKIDPTCTVSTSGGGDDGSNTGSNGNDGSNSDPCAPYKETYYGEQPPDVSQACADELQARYCDAIMAASSRGSGSWQALLI